MYRLSSFGTKLTRKTGILELMDDLGKAMGGQKGDVKMLGGGNPAAIPKVQEIFRRRMRDIVQDKGAFGRMIGNYTTPQGDHAFLQTFATFLRQTYGWKVTEKNIAVVSGSQTAFFFLFNMFAGRSPSGRRKRILLPLVPEYIGYADQGIGNDMFVGKKPRIDILGPHQFKYSIDFKTLSVPSDAGAICISRPTNPTGNVVSDEELHKLHALAKRSRIPLIVDNAYGSPGPNIMFAKTKPFWDEHVIHSISLSKFGLPGVRTSIVVAREEVIEQLSGINAITSLACNNVGPELARVLVEDGSFASLGTEMIRPFYEKKKRTAEQYVAKYLRDDIPYYLHKAEGALFLWLWCKDLPISSKELYQRLKKRNVIVVPGRYFFPGHSGSWKHKDECIRITYSQSERAVEEGIRIIGEELTNAYANK